LTIGGIIIPGLLLSGGLVWIVGAAWFMKSRARTSSRAEASSVLVSDERASHALNMDRYRRCRDLVADARYERKMTRVREANIDRALDFLRTSPIDKAAFSGMAALPDVVRTQLLQEQGIDQKAFVDEFIARPGDALFSTSNPAEAMHAMEQFADERLARLENAGWPQLCAYVEGHDDVSDTWLGQALRTLRRVTASPVVDVLQQSTWQLVLLPENTSDELRSKVRLSVPTDGQLICSGTNTIAVVQLEQWPRAAPSGGISLL
jgi:hypothetical protein